MGTHWITAIGLIVDLLIKLWPIVREVFAKTDDPSLPSFTRENAVEHIIERARRNGHYIGHSEAKMVIEALNYVKNKPGRHPRIENSGS